MVYKQRFQNPNYKSTASKNYAHVRYIATRPRVAKNEGMNHGLFGCLKPGTSLTEFQDWKDVARLVYQNSRRHVTMYRSVVSFGEDTARELLLADKKAWERYIENHIRTIAEKNSIRREHFQWAAALHREKGHPHLHVVFWDDSDEKAKIKNPFTHPSVPNNIRRQMIKDTFADRIRAYGEEKTKAAADLRKISDSLVDDFEGRIAYQLLSEELKKQVDALTAFLLSQVPELKKLRADYVESKMKMVHLYGGSEEYLASQRKKFESEADKMIANRILGMVKSLNRLDDEGRAAEYRKVRRNHYVEQMVLEMLDMLSSLVDTNCRQYDDFEKAWQGELSKEARKELYLKYQDRGYEH